MTSVSNCNAASARPEFHPEHLGRLPREGHNVPILLVEKFSNGGASMDAIRAGIDTIVMAEACQNGTRSSEIVG